MKFKKTLIAFIGLSLITLWGVSYVRTRDIALGATALNSAQVGASPSNGHLLQTNGSISTWVTIPDSFSTTSANYWLPQNPLTAGAFVATSTATSTLSGGLESGTKIGAPYLIATSSTATSTFYGGLIVGNGGGTNGLTVTGNALFTGTSYTPAVAAVTIAGSPQPAAATVSDVLLLDRPFNTGIFRGRRASIKIGSTNTVSAGGTRMDFALLSGGVTSLTDTTLPNVTVMTLTSDGLLGIGTTSPYSMLSVAGQIVGQNFMATSSTATSTFSGGVSVLNFAQTGSATSTFSNGIQLNGGCFKINGSCLTTGGGASSTLLSDVNTFSRRIITTDGSFQTPTGNSYFAVSDTLDTEIGTNTHFVDLYDTINGKYAFLNLSALSANTWFQFPNWSGEFAVSTSTLQVTSITATSTTATSTFQGNMTVSGDKITGKIDSAFVFATSTLGTGTTTIKVSGFKQGSTFNYFGCTSQGTGTFAARMGDSTASSSSVTSGTGNTTTFTTLSSNNSFNSGEAIYFEIGSVSGTVVDPSCSYQRTIN